MNVSRECFAKIIQLLLPHMLDEGNRKSLITSAFFGTTLLHQINFAGNANTFTVLLVSKLVGFGTLDNGEFAITTLLRVIQNQLGSNQHQQIEELIVCIESEHRNMDEEVPDLPLAQNQVSRKHLFISYASVDRVSFVDRIASDLTEVGHLVWVDNLSSKYGGITGGKPWQQELADALNQAILVIFVITPDSLRSKWVRAELNRAGQIHRPVIGVVAHPITMSEDRKLLETIMIDDNPLTALQYRDFTELGYSKGFDLLKVDINRHINEILKTTD